MYFETIGRHVRINTTKLEPGDIIHQPQSNLLFIVLKIKINFKHGWQTIAFDGMNCISVFVYKNLWKR